VEGYLTLRQVLGYCYFVVTHFPCCVMTCMIVSRAYLLFELDCHCVDLVKDKGKTIGKIFP
jgi:hypothetical protein